VEFPGYWHGKNTFFFFGYQKTFIRDQTAPSTVTIPTSANVAGNIPVLNGQTQITNPFTGATYPVNPSTGTAFIDPSNFDPASLALLKHVTVSSTSSATPVAVNFVKPVAQGFDDYVARADQNIGSVDHLVIRYFNSQFSNAGVLDLSNLPTYTDGSNIGYQNALVSDAHTFTNSLLNNFIVSYQRELSTRGPLSGGINVNDLGVPIWQPAFKAIQQISITSFFSVGDNPQATFQRSNMTLADDLHWVKGSHNLAFGFHGEVAKFDQNNINGQPGTFSFSSSLGNTALANFMFGYLATFSQASGQYQQNRAKFWGIYAQDNWKISRRLSLDYGVRYEPYLPLHEKGNRMGQFNPSSYASGRKSTTFPNAPAGLLFAGDSGFPRDGVRPVYANFMPRVGIAYDILGNGKLSVRGGGGMFYDTRSNLIFNNAWIGNAPFVTSVTLSPASTHFSNPYGSTTNPFPAAYPPPSNYTWVGLPTAITFDPSGNFKVPLTYIWNLTVEDQITKKLSSRIAYVGSHGSHIFDSPEINPAIYGSGATVANTNSRRLYPGYGTIALTDMGGNTSYQSLQATIQERASRGLNLTLNYTWSKALDNIPSGTGVTSAAAGNSFVMPVTMANYKRLDVGPSDFNHANVLTGTYVWDLPRVKEGPAILKAIVNDWQTNGILSARSGDRFQVLLGQDISFTAMNKDVPNVVGNPYSVTSCATSTVHCKAWLNSGAFATPSAGQFGTMKKNTFGAPNYVNFDTVLARRFKITETSNLQFRAEYFDVFNHTNFLSPGTSLANSSTFGKITTANDPRIAQLSLKFLF
jgi:hypothetical protein